MKEKLMPFAAGVAAISAAVSLANGSVARAEVSNKAVMKPFTGTVTEVSPSKIEVQKDSQSMQYVPGSTRQANEANLLSKIHVGDQVTLYTVNGKMKIKMAHKPSQEAGQKGQEILDDRAFYSADAQGR
jgi:hypothetical protein